jgi:tyrosine-protein kinase Etk/Wzc
LEQRVNLVEVLRILIAHRRFIALCTVVAFVVSAGISLVLPKWYSARATILPPDAATNQMDIAGMMRFAGYQPALIPTMTSPSEIYAAVLKSVRIKNAMIDSLDLMNVYGSRSRESARETLGERCRISVTATGLVEVRSEAKDPDRAADIANAAVKELDRFNRYSLVTSAGAVRRFIETRIEETVEELDRAEDELRKFKNETGTFMISEQTQASITTAAELYGMIAELEVARERLSQFATEKSPEIIDINRQIAALEEKLGEMGYNDSSSESRGRSRLFPKFSSAPDLEQNLAGLMREVEIKRAVFVVLSEQYEDAKVREMRDMPTVQVLDWGEPPEGPSRPKKKVIVAVSAICAFLLSSLYAMAKTRQLGSSGQAGAGLSVEMTQLFREDLRKLGELMGRKPGSTG